MTMILKIGTKVELRVQKIFEISDRRSPPRRRYRLKNGREEEKCNTVHKIGFSSRNWFLLCEEEESKEDTDQARIQKVRSACQSPCSLHRG
ncbi:hypothetical protein L6452_38126 [Arctium lappa]|uniref:Uncharacterized protein n=1 Tax=Arctium lappa TaxID=4217 RepID=A0ACB8Y6C8_ARCLA|nr:hypothetical protein L6452_38126 [Arctium lappa]